MFKEGVQKIANSKSKTFLAFCFLFLIFAGGATAFDGLHKYTFHFFVSSILFLILLSLLWQHKLFRFSCFLFLSITLGLWRGAASLPIPDDTTNIAYYADKQITFIGTVDAEPSRNIADASYRLEVQSVAGVQDKVGGKVLLKTKLYPEYHYGDTLKVTCKLMKPEPKEGERFRYDKYLAKDGIGVICTMPKSVVVIPTEEGRRVEESFSKQKDSSTSLRFARNDITEFFFKKIFAFKSIIAKQIDALWTEPESSFMAGLLFGARSGFPDDVKENFSKTGVTHIVAVSGFNTTIIATTLMTLLIWAGLWRQQAFWAVVTVLFLFVVFTGASASVVRAGIMGTLVLTAQHLGRTSRIGNVLVLTAALMVTANPYVLLWDAGFQLSFLSTMGLVYVSPLLNDVILNVAKRNEGSPGLFEGILRGVYTERSECAQDDSGRASSLVQTLLQTLSAIIATLPLILYQFGRLSIVAPLVNVLILFTIPWLMLGGFVAVVLSFVFFPLGQVAAWVSAAGLKYVLFVVEFFGKQRWSATDLEVPLWVTVVLYVGLVFVIARSEATKQSP